MVIAENATNHARRSLRRAKSTTVTSKLIDFDTAFSIFGVTALFRIVIFIVLRDYGGITTQSLIPGPEAP